MKTQKNVSVTLKLCESAIMIALATILSLLKLVDLPYGGSITFASMLPILLIAYRHGTGWGLLTASVHGVMQFILGTSVLSYVTGWQSIAAVILLDYFFAFALIGLAGVFKNMKSQKTALVLGALLTGALRYVCHVISGATVWAGLSIPTEAALLYSLSYNATYMVPETVILLLSAIYIGSAVDFRTKMPTRMKIEKLDAISSWLVIGAGLVTLGGLIADTVLVFSKLQNESGDFMIMGLKDVNWLAVGIITAACLLVAALLVTLAARRAKKI